MILNHDIVIILDKLETLRGTCTSGSLNVLTEQSVYTDNWLQENHDNENVPLEQRQAAHNWILGVQEKVTAMVGTVGDLVNECPV